MKDIPHHIQKIIRQTVRSQHREEVAEGLYNEPRFRLEETTKQKRKQMKQQIKNERLAHTPSPLSPEEQNKKMQKRIPRFRPISHKIGAR